MLTSVVAILSGRSKIKITALLSVAALLLCDNYELIEIPTTDLGGWFRYGLEISLLALSVSILVDVFSIGLEAIKVQRIEAKEVRRKKQESLDQLYGNISALSEIEVFFLVYVRDTYDSEIKVSLEFESEGAKILNALFEQGMFIKVGGTKHQPRWLISPVVLDSIHQLNLDQYNDENERYLWEHEDAINSVVWAARA